LLKHTVDLKCSHLENIDSTSKVVNAMTIDVEDYFQVSAFEQHIGRHTWEEFPSRIEANMEKILRALDTHKTFATFFILGWVAEKYPNLVQTLAQSGHEIASHGWWHQRVSSLTPEQFAVDVRKSKECLEAVSGMSVKGYRAPSYSINNNTPWAHDILAEEGYLYSSSIAPIKHDHYGIPDSPRFPHRRGIKQLLEVPVSTSVVCNRNIACGGGGWFRLYPYALSRLLIKRINEEERQAVVFYTHPWEFDPEQPRQLGLNMRTKFRHYINLEKIESRFDRVLSDFTWNRMDNILGSEISLTSPMLTDSIGAITSTKNYSVSKYPNSLADGSVP